VLRAQRHGGAVPPAVPSPASTTPANCESPRYLRLRLLLLLLLRLRLRLRLRLWLRLVAPNAAVAPVQSRRWRQRRRQGYRAT
jgi:hypothetical protein